MRARYSAYVVGNIDFLIDTYHSSCNAHLERSQIKVSADIDWVKLEILEAIKVKPTAEQAFVEFKAWYMEAGELCVLHERSRFTREDCNQHWQWRYLEAVPITAQSATKVVGRNALCPCNSGKKYKKCCLLTDNL